MFKRAVATIAACIVAAAAAATPARAQDDDRLSLIRDTEVEAIIRTFATPLWKAAGLTPSSVHIFLVNDRALNAFVAGGQNLFITTGLLIRADSAGQVIGVIAHETGHMAGGHLARMPEAMRNAMITSLLAVALGVVGGVAGGGGSVGAASVMGGMSMAERNIFAFSRAQEGAADQAGMTFLDLTGQSARGMLHFMEILSHKEFLSPQQQDPYLRTHPLTSERIDAIRYHVEHSRYSDVPVAPELEQLDRRMRAKLAAFLDPPSRTLDAYPASDHGVEARYARAIAYYRIPDMKAALHEIDGLIADYPKDPYFYELRSQMLFENGRVAEALPSQREAVNLMPDAALMRVDLAHIELELNDPSLVADAEQNLTSASRVEPDLPDLWRLLAVAHGRSGEIGLAAVALAEQALLEGRRYDARDQARRAMRMLPTGSPGWLKAQDVEGQAQRRRE